MLSRILAIEYSYEYNKRHILIINDRINWFFRLDVLETIYDEEICIEECQDRIWSMYWSRSCCIHVCSYSNSSRCICTLIEKTTKSYFCFRVCTFSEKTSSRSLYYKSSMIVLSEYTITYSSRRFARNLLCRRISETRDKTMYSTACFNVVLFLYFAVCCNLFVLVRNLLRATFIWSK